ncbi:hypothetical protein FDP41_002193 [Naegleria fowleri]|uniref:Uncharacterized protein n=1 Tax=Naegleria fowleri TaxID=5763 RepID=A0A6A5BM87_NAEFO|nr:uncharacterized protein FDP41_002193 [Naegleria fowleri]KAF0979123.1 hypothetical protein FDP41_002193 [Naegleria fowleri]
MSGVYLYFSYLSNTFTSHDWPIHSHPHRYHQHQHLEQKIHEEEASYEHGWIQTTTTTTIPTNEHQLRTNLSTLSLPLDLQEDHDTSSIVPNLSSLNDETKLNKDDDGKIVITHRVITENEIVEDSHLNSYETFIPSNQPFAISSVDSHPLKTEQLPQEGSQTTLSGSRVHDHLLSKHSFLMVCSKCNYLFATFLPSSRIPEQECEEFPERFVKHPFTFGVLKLDNDNRRRNVAFMPRFHVNTRNDSQMKDEQEDEDGNEQQEEENAIIPTLCSIDTSPLEQEFICKKIEEAELSQMKDLTKRERDAGKLLRLYCKNCNTKVGSILKNPLNIQVAPNLSLPFNTFMDQQDCSIIEKCHCQPHEHDETKYVNSNNIVISDQEDEKTFRKTTLGEWKYSTLASMLFEMPESRKDLKPQKRNFMQNKFHHNNKSRSTFQKKFTQDNSEYSWSTNQQKKKLNFRQTQKSPNTSSTPSEQTNRSNNELQKRKKGQKRKNHPKSDASNIQNSKNRKQSHKHEQ